MSRVFSIEDDGMKNAWMTKLLMISASTSARHRKTGNSIHHDLGARRLGGGEAPTGLPPPGGPSAAVASADMDSLNSPVTSAALVPGGSPVAPALSPYPARTPILGLFRLV